MMANQATELLHLTYEGNFQLETDAAVIKCLVISDESAQNSCESSCSAAETETIGRQVRIELQLDKTTMHPQGGGQPTDVGIITCFVDKEVMSAEIDKVTIDRATGIATHAGSITLLPSNNDVGSVETSIFSQSKVVRVSVEPSNRRLLSECHTAGHVVDAAMAKCEALLPPTKGYHFMDGPYVEYKGSIENKDEFLRKLQDAYTELIEEDISTTIQTLPASEAELICNRLAQNFNMSDFCTEENPNVRIVNVAGYSCPCGGTHVKSTGELKEKGWCVKGLRCKKGVVRVRYGPGSND